MHANYVQYNLLAYLKIFQIQCIRETGGTGDKANKTPAASFSDNVV